MRRDLTRGGLAILGLVLLTGVVLAKKPQPPPEPDPDPAIAYRTVSGKGKHESCKLMVMNADGTNQTVVYDAGDYWISGVDWSPAGDQLVMTTATSDGPGIYVIDLDGSDLTKVAATTGNAGRPVWSPDAVPGIGGDVECIAYPSTVTGETTNVIVVPLDGSDPFPLPTPDGYTLSERAPTWSPSGTKIAFNVKDYDQALKKLWGLYDFEEGEYTLKEFGGGEITVVDAWCASWSKTEEDEIAWSISLGGGGHPYDIWVLDLDGAPVRQVTDTSAIAEHYPSFSPLDARIVAVSIDYESRGAHTYEVMDADDGTDREVIAEDLHYDPVWRKNAD